MGYFIENHFSIKEILMTLFHFERLDKGNDPETAEATMEGLAFPGPHLRVAGSEVAGRRSCLSFPVNVRKIDAGKRVLSRREGGLGNGVKNPNGEQGRFRIVSQGIFPNGNCQSRHLRRSILPLNLCFFLCYPLEKCNVLESVRV
jgi:hypothetical protein